MSKRYNDGSHYENHQRAEELHDGAAHTQSLASSMVNRITRRDASIHGNSLSTFPKLNMVTRPDTARHIRTRRDGSSRAPTLAGQRLPGGIGGRRLVPRRRRVAIPRSRCMNIPRGICTGYLGDIRMPPTYGVRSLPRSSMCILAADRIR